MVVLLKASVQIFQLSVFLRVLYAPLYVCYLVIKLMKFKKGAFLAPRRPRQLRFLRGSPFSTTHTPDSSPFKFWHVRLCQVAGSAHAPCGVRVNVPPLVFHKGTLHYFDIAVLPWPERPPVLSISFL